MSPAKPSAPTSAPPDFLAVIRWAESQPPDAISLLTQHLAWAIGVRSFVMNEGLTDRAREEIRAKLGGGALASSDIQLFRRLCERFATVCIKLARDPSAARLRLDRSEQ